MAEKAATKVRMGEITGGEARTLYARNPVILLPLGSHEDQGPHAPMGDYLLAEKVAELIALRATAAGTDCVVAPVLPFGKADYFGSMPGGIALSAATIRALLDDVFACLLRHGLTRLVVLNGHGGNVEVVREATHDVWQARKLLIPSLYLWRIAAGLLPGIIGAAGARAAAGHGADPLTSVGLHLSPERMRVDLLPESSGAEAPRFLGLPFQGWGALDFDGAEVGVPLEYDAVSPNGVGSGDPRMCSAATGEALTGMLVDIGARFVAHFAARA